MLGRAEEAWETFVKTAPDNPKNPLGVSLVEPFSFTNSYSMCEHVYGRAGYPWRTGTAGWMTVLLMEWVLGARRSHEGLLIEPCLTRAIPHARVTRRFRGAVYEIELDNSAGRCTGASAIRVDGERVEGRVLPDLREGTHRVEVVV
jgi:cellobiose phosphorylase